MMNYPLEITYIVASVLFIMGLKGSLIPNPHAVVCIMQKLEC